MNRFSEGLRIIEDFVRFEKYDEKILKDIRKIREDFYSIRKSISNNTILKRDSLKDVGKTFSFDKNVRKDVQDIIKSSFGRSEESSRVLEEIFKIKDLKISARFKNIRFKLYDLEKEFFKKFFKKRFPDDFGLYLIMTSPLVGYEKLSELAVKFKIKVIQLREKFLSTKKVLNIARNIKSIVKGSETFFIVDDRVDIALLSDADGVHVGQTDLLVNEVKRFSENIFIGKSTHSITQIKNAVKEFPDYVGIGPIYPTDSKPIKDKVLGKDKSKRMLNIPNIPVVGIGGIKPYNLKEVLSIGFKNYAVLSYINGSENPSKKIKEFFDVERSYYEN